jgi:hypothetical protein
MRQAIELKETVGSFQHSRPFSLCEAVNTFDEGAGLYEIESLISYLEESSEPEQKGLQPFTYVQFRLLEAWTPTTPIDPLVRMRGGAFGDGVFATTTVGLSKGQHVGALFFRPTDYNRGFHAIADKGIFRQVKDDVFTNGYEVTGSLSETRELIASRFGLSEEECKKLDPDPAEQRDEPPLPEPDGPAVDIVGEELVGRPVEKP